MARVTLPISVRFTSRSESLNTDSSNAEVLSILGRNRVPETTCMVDAEHSDLPDDGFNVDDYDVSGVSTNLIVRKTFLELEPMENAGMAMRGCKSDAWIVGARRAQIADLNRLCLSAWSLDEKPACDSTSSTRESSTDEQQNVGMRRQKSVKIAATEWVQRSTSGGSVIEVTRVHGEDIPRQRTRTESHASTLNVPTANTSTYRRRAKSNSSIVSSPMCRGRADSRASVVSTRTTGSLSPTCRTRFETDFSPTYVYNPHSFGTGLHTRCCSLQQTSAPSAMTIAKQCDHAITDICAVQPSVSVSAIVSLHTAPVVMLSPCALAVPPTAPAGHFPHRCGNMSLSEAAEETEGALEPVPTIRQALAAPPGKFFLAHSEDASEEKVGEATKKQRELGELDEQQKRLQDERERLLAMTGVSSNVPMSGMFSHQHPPGQWSRPKEIDQSYIRPPHQEDVKLHERTTLVLRNLPDGFTRAKIEELLNVQGFAQRFNFIYAPVRFETMTISGYAFVNFVTTEAAHECLWKLDGFAGWDQPHENACEVIWSEKDQGLAVIIDRHRNSPIMHSSVREEFKPAVYKNGIQISFPAPTKKVRPPKVQKCKKEANNECC